MAPGLPTVFVGSPAALTATARN
ncbi:uncharacterized protein METZ01_LOCUS230167 [marine metagenome]|uniref:Uncharacterized protein n=1 Tax=marine metagenome TaxID=408172 RepID=A0A382GRX2_9ZZZZ